MVAAMYEVDDRDRVILLDDVPPLETGAPLPIVLADENSLLLSYLIPSPDTNRESAEVESVSPISPHQTVLLVRFERPSAHVFGPPNDEALQGHPLAKRGLDPYAAFEVLDSSWIRKLERMNSVHPYHNRDRFFNGKRHFVFTFHDSTFECVARGYVVERMTGSLGDALDRMCELLCKKWN